jgi:hypothetical protein
VNFLWLFMWNHSYWDRTGPDRTGGWTGKRPNQSLRRSSSLKRSSVQSNRENRQNRAVFKEPANRVVFCGPDGFCIMSWIRCLFPTSGPTKGPAQTSHEEKRCFARNALAQRRPAAVAHPDLRPGRRACAGGERCVAM